MVVNSSLREGDESFRFCVPQIKPLSQVANISNTNRTKMTGEGLVQIDQHLCMEKSDFQGSGLTP